MPKRKRSRPDNSNQVSAKISRPTHLEPKFENAVTQSTVIDEFFAFLPADSLARLSTTNKLFSAFYKQDRYEDTHYWEKKFDRDFHITVFNSHYKEQYIAEYLLKKAQTADPDNLYYVRLKQHIDQYLEFDWVHYYLAILSERAELKDFYGKKATLDHALTAVGLGELRAGQFIIDYIDTSLGKNMAVGRHKLDRLLEHLSHVIKPSVEVKKLRCFAHFLMARYPLSIVVINLNLNEALRILLKLLLPDDREIAAFLDLVTTAFRLSGLITAEYAYRLRHARRLLDCVTVFDAVTLLVRNQKLPHSIRGALTSWLRKLENAEHPIACYYAAENIRKNITAKLVRDFDNYIDSQAIDTELKTAFDYYKKAVAGGEYRAIGEGLDHQPGGLHKLLELKPQLPLLEHGELLAMINEGIVQDNDKFCILILAKEYMKKAQWHKDPHKIWIVQLAASYTDQYADPAYKALLKLTDNPDTSLYVHCALSLVQATKRNAEASYQLFKFVARINPGQPEKYLAHGRLIGLCEEIDEIIFSRHAKTRQEELPKIAPPSNNHYFLRKC